MLALLMLLLPAGDVQQLEYRAAGCGQPLQGLVPYDGDWAEWAAGQHDEKPGRVDRVFPHTMEYSYFPLGELAPKPGEFDWAPLERKLDQVASRGHQMVFRVFIEYPGRSNGLPKWLADDGVAVTRWRSDTATEAEEGLIITPDYEDPRLRDLLVDFVEAMGAKYDGDPRVGYITAGLIGIWGEWHTYPKPELMASPDTQKLVLDAYERAFESTPILLRYPSDASEEFANNVGRRFGYHDDSFAWATLPTGRNADDWFFLSLMDDAGAGEQWKTQPIGGEIRPELWGKIFDAPIGQPKRAHRKAQDFMECVERSHVTWLMESGFFGDDQPTGKKGQKRFDNALERVARMGYEFHVRSCRYTDDNQLEVTVANTGVAPLYHDWQPTLQVATGDSIQTVETDWSLAKLLPDEEASFVIHLPDAANAEAPVLMQIPNALPGARPIKFANSTQDQDIDGWLTLPR